MADSTNIPGFKDMVHDNIKNRKKLQRIITKGFIFAKKNFPLITS